MIHSSNKFVQSFVLIFTLSSYFFCFSHTGDHSKKGKLWMLQNDTISIQANFILFKNQAVYHRELNSNKIIDFPLNDFSMKDQLLILKQHKLSGRINSHQEKISHIEINEVKKFSKTKVEIALMVLFFLVIFFVNLLDFSKVRKPTLISLFCLIFTMVLIACSTDEENIPDEIVSTPPTPKPDPPAIDTSTTDSTSASDTTSSINESSTTDNIVTEGTLINTVISHFEDYSGVTITSDEEYFYVNSYSWPEHGMGVGITSWQEQVPIPQNYTGGNSWVIPLNPEMADEPLSTSDHLLKGALAIAINGVPIFNVYNNRGENAYLIGELDDWGGHFGRGDDYHYHLIPTHLEETVGTEQPLAYALDGYPIYGYTNETLDEAFGRYEGDNYRYHAKTEAPYYMPIVMGKVTIDPNSTAPEDQIYPQPVQNPIRASNNFKPVNGASVTGFIQTGTNAFSFEYTVNGIKYYVNYNWDCCPCTFTYTYVDENGGIANLPTYGAISDTSQNTGVYNNVSFCQDVNLGAFEYIAADYSSSLNAVSGEMDISNDTSSNSDSVGFSVTSDKSNFTLSSSAIDSEGTILDDYKCEQKVNGVEKSIPIAWSNIPDGTGSIAISIHAFPKANEINSYLTLWNIDPNVTEISYGGANDGVWYMGPNKDGASISYSSPCSPSSGSSTYYLTIYALSETPSSLPENDSLTVNYSTLLESLSEVTIVDEIILEYVSVTD